MASRKEEIIKSLKKMMTLHVSERAASANLSRWKGMKTGQLEVILARQLSCTCNLCLGTNN
jgi:hypothetical protein